MIQYLKPAECHYNGICLKVFEGSICTFIGILVIHDDPFKVVNEDV
jgi:hypothetical protein